MKKIYTKNLNVPVLVDDDDYDYLNQFKWYFGNNGYVVRNLKTDDGKWTRQTMHREVLKVPRGMDTEHKDRNRTNNQKANLRAATRSQNMANVKRAKAETAHSQFKGVSRLKRKNLLNQWMAYIKVDYKMYYLGYYATEEEAAHMYNQFACQIFEDFAHLNDI